MTVRFIRSSHDDDLSLVVRTGYLNQVCGFIFFVHMCKQCPESRRPLKQCRESRRWFYLLPPRVSRFATPFSTDGEKKQTKAWKDEWKFTEPWLGRRWPATDVGRHFNDSD